MPDSKDECLPVGSELLVRSLRDLTLNPDAGTEHIEQTLSLIDDPALRKAVLNAELEGRRLHALITERFGPDVVRPHMEGWPPTPANVTEVPAGGDVTEAQADVIV